jgi:DNA polymerase-4
VLVQARHRLYADYHNRIVAAVESCVPVEKICSIDEMACRLTGRERDIDEARRLAAKVKATIRAQVGDCLTCSIGLAPNLFLGKVGSDMQKPDGLVTITRADLPGILYRLNLTDIYGIGPRMAARLQRMGIETVEQLTAAPRQVLRQAWGGVTGLLYHELLRGEDLQFPSSAESRSMGHQHVLEPSLRTFEGARTVARHLLAKAAARLRSDDYYCRRLGLHIRWAGDLGGHWDEVGFHETRETGFLLERLDGLWRAVPRYKPVKVGVVLFGLVPAARHQPDLFAEGGRRERLSPLVDAINRRHGRDAIGFGLLPEKVRAFAGHAAFGRVPELWEFDG